MKLDFTKGIFYIKSLGQSSESEDTQTKDEDHGYRTDVGNEFTKSEREVTLFNKVKD